MRQNWRRRPWAMCGLLWFSLVNVCCLLAATGQEDVFTIRAEVAITAEDAYHYVRSSNGSKIEEIEEQDSFTYLFTGQQIQRVTNNKWQTTESSSYSIGGGGNSVHSYYPGGEPPQIETLSWVYELDPSQYNPTNSDISATLQSKFAKCAVRPGNKFPVKQNLSAGYAQLAAFNVYFDASLLFPPTIQLPTNTTSYTVTQTYSTNLTLPHNAVNESGQTTASYQCTVTIQRNPAELEAVILPDPPSASLPNYADWIPVGGANEKEAGTNLIVRVILRQKGSQDTNAVSYGQAKFSFSLNDTSQEPGVCMNWPPKDEAVDTPDLRFHPSDELKVSDDGQFAETGRDDLSSAGILVDSFDYGAYAKLSVTAQIPGQGTISAFVNGHPDQVSLAIPKDYNNNHIADAWEKEQGVFDQNLPAKWDGAPKPAGQAADGDGLSLYEKYRGLFCMPDGVNRVYQRLDPNQKFLFVNNPDHLVIEAFGSTDGSPESYPVLAQCPILYVGSSDWTGPGSYGAYQRIVNFNFSQSDPGKHATDQHALDVRVNTSKSPMQPGDWNDLRQSLGLAPDSSPIGRLVEGCTYRDVTGPSFPTGNHWSPGGTFRVDIYATGVDTYVLDTVEYHSARLCLGCTNDAQKTALAQQLMADNQAYYRTKYTIELSATCAHEMGHGTGVDHHHPTNSDPNDPGLKDCTMRYYGPNEFPADVDDLFELAARGHNPSQFCMETFNCWGQLRISDDPDAPASAAPAALPGRGTIRPGAASRLANPSGNRRTAAPRDAVPAALSLSADLVWIDLVTGDPLRLEVRLHGPTDQLASNWIAGVQIYLTSVPASGQAQLVLGADAWKNLLQPLWFDTASLAVSNVTRIREWLASPELVKLSPGTYTLAIAWDGRGLAPAACLPASGIVSLPAMTFVVQDPTTPALQALNERHLAWWRYLLDDDAGTLEHAQRAARLDPKAVDPLAVESQFLLANAELRLGQLFQAVQTMSSLSAQLPDPNNHAGLLASYQYGLFAPKLRLLTLPGQGPARLQVSALAGEKYALQASDDLKQWKPVSTNAAPENVFEVLDSTGPAKGARYYRVQWIP